METTMTREAIETCIKAAIELGEHGVTVNVGKATDAILALGQQTTDELTALRERVGALTDHISEQSEHCRVRIQDGIEMGATVWRLALEDVMRENAAILAHPKQGGGE